ncbi:hypothetical protein Tco_0613086 [Tanacetum coccineum]
MSSSTVTYTSISFESNLPPWGFHLMDPDEFEAPLSPEQTPPSPDYVPGTEYPEYVAPSDDEIPVEDQPLPADASPIALSPGYVADSDPFEEDPKDDPKEDPADYPSNGGDDDEEEERSSKDDDDDKEEGEASEEDEEEEEHLALADSALLPAIDPVPLAEETKPFETDESAATPPPPPHTIVPSSMTRHHRARIFVRPHTPLSPSTKARIVEYASALTPSSPPPSPLLPLSSLLLRIPSPPLLLPPPHTSLTYASAPLGYRAAMVQTDILKTEMPPRKRVYFIAPTRRFEVRESSTAIAARHTGHTLARRVDYGFIDTVDASI